MQRGAANKRTEEKNNLASMTYNSRVMTKYIKREYNGSMVTLHVAIITTSGHAPHRFPVALTVIDILLVYLYILCESL